ncbi:MAG: peptidoglycan DD-metalloendopeptidase family protein, partial [Ardenticatenales bacterium]
AVTLILALAAAGCRAADTVPLPRPPAPTPGRAVERAAPPLALSDAAPRAPDVPPEARDGAPCGYVDRMDTPLGAPDGRGFQVRWPYGRVSRRYDGKLHAGEDWLALSETSFGRPVSAVAHGQVVYAQPWGWGTDQGVIIVRHTFAPGTLDDDGAPLRTILSFYGHVDPPSVAVKGGECVARGQVIAAVGKPRGVAHLHFEVRSQWPDTPGPGYWPTDPGAVGWRAPSVFMTSFRLRSTAGAQWLAPFTPTLGTALGPAGDGRLVVPVEGGALAGLEVATGRAAWRFDVEGGVRSAALDAAGDVIYIAQQGGVAAYEVARAGEANVRPAWRHASQGPPSIVALAEGGVAVAAGGTLRAVGPDGVERWRVDGVGDVPAMAANERWLVLGGTGHAGAWTIPAAGGRAIVRPGLPGAPTVAGDGVYFDGPAGITWLSLVAAEPPRTVPLAASHLEHDQIIALDDGVAVAHRGPDVLRLLRFGADGALRWERDIGALGRRLPRLVRAGAGLFAIGAGGDVTAIDPVSGEATRTFNGIPVEGLTDAPWAAALEDGTIIGRVPLDGGRLMAFRAPAAVARR